jgi:hypothetical protein
MPACQCSCGLARGCRAAYIKACGMGSVWADSTGQLSKPGTVCIRMQPNSGTCARCMLCYRFALLALGSHRQGVGAHVHFVLH